MNARILTLSAVVIIAGCASEPASLSRDALVGAWRSEITFRSGALAAMKGLQFLYAYNAGGTMTESSNYDEAANSSPPAYGVWREVGPRRFETRYEFFTTRSPEPADGAPGGGDWWPAGRGVLTETITLSEDGQTYASTIKLAVFDNAGQPIAGGGEGTGQGRRLLF